MEKKEKDVKGSGKTYTAQEAMDIIKRVVGHVDGDSTNIIALVWDKADEDADGSTKVNLVVKGGLEWAHGMAGTFAPKEGGKIHPFAALIYSAQAFAVRSLGADPCSTIKELVSALEEDGV